MSNLFGHFGDAAYHRLPLSDCAIENARLPTWEVAQIEVGGKACFSQSLLVNLLFAFRGSFFNGKGGLVVLDVAVETGHVFGRGLHLHASIACEDNLVEIVC